MHKYMGQNIAEKLGDLTGLTPEDRDVAAYGLEYLLSGAISVALTLLAGFILGIIQETVAVLLCWGILRLFAGGAHCTVLWRCTVISCASIITAGLLSKGAFVLVPVAIWVTASMTWTLLSVWLWAPNNSERPVDNLQRSRMLRRKALTVVMIASVVLFFLAISRTENLQALATAGATGFAAGALMLSPPGFRLIRWVDKKLECIDHTLRKGGETP